MRVGDSESIPKPEQRPLPLHDPLQSFCHAQLPHLGLWQLSDIPSNTNDRLTFGNYVVSDLILGTGFIRNPGKVRGQVPALEEIVEITDRISWARTQYLGQGYMTEFAYLVEIEIET